MIVWTVWVDVSDWPEDGGGAYLQRIFQNKGNAEKYCEQMNREAKENEEENISFHVEEWPLY